MKKTLCLLAAVAASAAGLSACGSTGPAPSLANASDNSTGVQVSAQLHEKEYKSEDGKMLLGKYAYTVPYMTGPSDDESSVLVVECFNDEINSILKEESKSWDEAMEDAQDYYETAGSDGWSYGSYWVDELNYTANQTDTLISMRFDHYVYTGGAHGYTYYTSQMFAMKEACTVTLEEMTSDQEGLRQAVTDEILRKIDAEDLAVQYSYWNDYADYVNGWMDDHSVYFLPEEDGRGMEVIFPAYELASYASGPQTFVVDAEVYAPYLNDYGRLLLGLDGE